MTVIAGKNRGKGIIVTAKMDSMEGYNCVRRAGRGKDMTVLPKLTGAMV